MKGEKDLIIARVLMIIGVCSLIWHFCNLKSDQEVEFDNFMLMHEKRMLDLEYQHKVYSLRTNIELELTSRYYDSLVNEINKSLKL